MAGGCFTNVWCALQNNLAKLYNARNHIYGENFRLKLCTCAQSMALGTRTKFQLDIPIRSTISTIHKFRENILESSRNVSETTPRSTLAQVMDWCPTAPSHYLNQCWLIAKGVLRIHPKAITQVLMNAIRSMCSENTLEIIITSPRVQWVNSCKQVSGRLTVLQWFPFTD